MKKLILILLPFLSVMVFQSCTKDRVPNPDSLNVPQTIFYQTNFDSLTTLPSGWSAPGSGGWGMDTSNASAGYAGASGKSNVSVSNPTANNATFTLETKGISTLHYNNIKVIYGARRTKHFSDNGSVISLAWSIDDGHTWNVLPYQENTNDSNWYLINGAARIALPAAAANQPNLKLQWTANLQATSSGTYRIDDFQVFGSAM